MAHRIASTQTDHGKAVAWPVSPWRMEETLARGWTAGKGRAIWLILVKNGKLPLPTVNDLATHPPIGESRISGDDKSSPRGCKAAGKGELLLIAPCRRVPSHNDNGERLAQVMRNVFRSLALAAALAISSASAQAVTVSYQGIGPFRGTSSAGVTVKSIADPDTTVSAKAGGFALKGNIFGNGEENFVAWCLDILHVLANHRNYEVTNTPFLGDPLTKLQVSNIGKLFNTAYADLAIKVQEQSAGFQLALWEIIYEDPKNAFDLRAGNLSVTGHNKVLDAGQAFLNNLAKPATGSWNLVFLQSTTKNQNLVTATPVPVPAAAGLMLLALGGLAAAGRRRRTA